MVTRRNASRQRATAPAPADTAPAGVGPLAPGERLTSLTQSPDQSDPIGEGSGLGGPVDWASDLAPWRSPQYVPGAPQRLPGLVRGPISPLIGAASATTPTPSVSSATTVLDPHHYANVVSGVLNVTQNATQAPFLLQPASLRNMLSLRNGNAAGNIYIDFQQSASANSPIKIVPGQTYLFDEVVPQNDIYAFADAPALVLCFSSSNIAGIPPP